MAQHRRHEQVWQEKLDERQYRLNAASVDLTKMVRRVWGDESVTLKFVADGQYLKVVVQDDIGVEVELDQRSDGFRWLVSFFVVFRAQAKGDLKNAILLLDEPGLSLHALKQQEFRKTVSLLAENNQIVYTTHSPFMVGPDELHLVRVVQMTDRSTGTKVHTTLIVDDPRSVYPLQAALGYELAQSLFGQKRNLVCEGITDMWMLEGVTAAMREAGVATMRADIAITPAQSASKVIYYCTLLRGQRLKVAALLDSDAAGDQAATQDEFIRLMRQKEILRAKDFYIGEVTRPETEDLLRDTLMTVAREILNWDVTLCVLPRQRVAAQQRHPHPLRREPHEPGLVVDLVGLNRQGHRLTYNRGRARPGLGRGARAVALLTAAHAGRATPNWPARLGHRPWADEACAPIVPSWTPTPKS